MSGRPGVAGTVRVCAPVMGLLVLVLSVVTSGVAARDKQVAAQDGQLRIVLEQQTDILASYFERARTINSLLAANPVFIDFYRAPGTNQAKIDDGGPLITRVNDALAYLEHLYPGRIGEACFIDSSGAEIARVVNGVPARPDELSRDEDSNAFFAPTLAHGPGTVHQAEEYESPDTHDQVISNSTAVTANGHTGIVHFEITLDSFRMTESAGGLAASIIDARTGHVIVDSRTPTSTAVSSDETFLRLAQGGRNDAVTTLGGRRIAYHRLPLTEGNANDWYVAASAPDLGGGWARGLGVGSLALLAAALLTILISAASWANHLRSVRRAASHDALTGLPNRTLLTERIEAALGGKRPATVLVIDLKRFREVNELLGHGTGDRLLIQVAERISAVAPVGATTARIGGDDFAVLIPGPADVSAVAEQVLDALRHTFVVDGLSLSLEAVAGGAHSTDNDATTLLRNADSALRLAKRDFDDYHMYDPAGEQHAPNRLALLGDLRRALDTEDQITVHYQPKVDLRSGRLAGVEALIRWDHPEQGQIAPDLFIPMAESTTLIHTLTTRVLDVAVHQSRTWLDRGLRVPVAVNLSTRCLLDTTLPRRIFDLLHRTGLPVELLDLEITESMIMANPGRAIATLRELHQGGIRLSVDDFGTGHSSMAYLQQLPVDELKIDRSFVQAMARGGTDNVLVRTAISLGHSLGLSVVAEGVETKQDVDALRALGCDTAQGFHFARPMPADEFPRWHAAFTAAASSTLTDAAHHR